MTNRARDNEGLVFLKWLSFAALAIMLVLKLSGAIDWSWWIVLLPGLVWVFSLDDFLLAYLLFHHHDHCDDDHDLFDD